MTSDFRGVSKALTLHLRRSYGDRPSAVFLSLEEWITLPPAETEAGESTQAEKTACAGRQKVRGVFEEE